MVCPGEVTLVPEHTTTPASITAGLLAQAEPVERAPPNRLRALSSCQRPGRYSSTAVARRPKPNAPLPRITNNASKPRTRALAEPYATRPETSLSLPIRMEKKRKRTRVGTAALVVAAPFLAGAGYNFTIRGSELIAVWLTLMGLGALAVGITSLRRASKDA